MVGSHSDSEIGEQLSVLSEILRDVGVLEMIFDLFVVVISPFENRYILD